MLIGAIKNNKIQNIINITYYNNYVINGNFEVNLYIEDNKIKAKNNFNTIIYDDIILIPDKIWIKNKRDYNIIINNKELFEELKKYYSIKDKLLKGIITFNDLI